jgi:hypothetical protein
MRYVVLFASVAILAIGAAQAQDEPAEREAETDVTVENAGDIPDYQDLTAGPVGDVVFLEDGREIKNVQVVRQTTTHYEVEVVEGVPPMSLPVNMVDRIEYDDYDPVGSNVETVMHSDEPSVLPEGMVRDEEGNVEILPKLKVPAEIVGMLRKDITPQVSELSGKQLSLVLNAIKRETKLPIVMGNPLKAQASKKPDALQVKVELKEGEKVNVAQFLHNHLLKLKAMQNIAIVYRPDLVLVTTKEAAKKITEEMQNKSAE